MAQNQETLHSRSYYYFTTHFSTLDIHLIDINRSNQTELLNTKIKPMKKLLILLLLATTILSAQNATFKIIKQKTVVDAIGAVILYVEVINNSKKEIKILKPATDYSQKWRFYNCDINCNNIPLWESAGNRERLIFAESDLIKIPAKSKQVLSVNGRYNCNMLSCESETFEIKLIYDVREILQNPNVNNGNLQEIEMLKKLTLIKIESALTKINRVIK